ncbi:MAG: radical SAM protein [Desulfovibrio sp.]|nr:MAG: radical SAM protein [Desulfovibrio sp.]
MVIRELTPEKYYRLPWNLADNAITWLEPTTKCNLYCEGCYRENDPGGHRPLDDVKEELLAVKKLRKTDGISIAGGEPLIYPDIVELVRFVKEQGWKPIINSNGHALTPELVRDLKDAGLIGFTMHVDSHQRRPGWTGKNELELNELRESLSQMIHKEGKGKIACAFNATIYRDTLDDIPMLTRWAHENIKYVHTMVYILFRCAQGMDKFVPMAKGQPIDARQLMYSDDKWEGSKDILAQEIADKIREDYPDYEPCGYLNGTEDSRSMKWLLGLRVGYKDKILGYMDAKYIEFIQSAHHYLFGTYLAYSRPGLMRNLQYLMPLMLFNKSWRKIFWRVAFNPLRWFRSLRMQSQMIIQPCDVFEDGRQSMCDGCPDAIYYKGRLVWSCRVDELEKFGAFIEACPSSEFKGEAPAKAGMADFRESAENKEALEEVN